jgi:hypothetical protein
MNLKLALMLVTAIWFTDARADRNSRFPLPAVPIPTGIIGMWCATERRPDDEGGVTIYNKIEKEEECQYEAPLVIRPDGYEEMWDNCPFTRVEKSPGGYLVYTHCEMLAEGDGSGLGKYYDRLMEFRIDEYGHLTITEIPET